jgi:hypothetical protein
MNKSISKRRQRFASMAESLESRVKFRLLSTLATLDMANDPRHCCREAQATPNKEHQYSWQDEPNVLDVELV